MNAIASSITIHWSFRHVNSEKPGPEKRELERFHEAIRTKDFTLTAQLQLAQETGPEAVLQQAKALAPVVDAIQVTRNPGGLVHMSTLAAASLLIRNDIDALVHMHCRDSNRIALQSELLGAKAIGVTSLLVQRGNKLPDDYRPKTTEVYDIGSKALINTATRMNSGDPVTDFFIGAVITAFKPRPGWKAKSLVTKIEAGTRFLQTQMCFDTDILRHYAAGLVELRLTHKARFVASIATLPSAEMARWVRDNVRGAVMPQTVIQRLTQAADPELEGVRICAELLQELREIPGIGGAHILTPGDVTTIPAAVKAAG